MNNLYIISGCNGAGKTTASYTVLPKILNCKEFINADEIAKGLSPFQPETVAIEAGRIMLHRIDELLKRKVDFAIETTLSTRSYINTIKIAHENGYVVTLLYFWLSSPELAIERVKERVASGGHHIPTDVINRRYKKGIENFFKLYQNKVDYWFLIDNTNTPSEKIADNVMSSNITIYNNSSWQKLNKIANGN